MTGRQVRASVAMLVTLLAVGGCSTGQGGASSATAPSATGRATGEAATASPTAPATRAPDLPAPTAIERAKRPGSPVTPPHTVRPGRFGAASVYDDGVEVTVKAPKKGKSSGVGAGAMPGADIVETDVTVRAGRTELDLSTAVVSARYLLPGERIERASQVTYVEGSRDLSGRVKARGTTTAHYAFFVPAGARVRVVVDLAGDRAPGVFTS